MTAWMRSMLIRALVALPFHNRQCGRSTSPTFRRLPRRIVARQSAGDRLQVPRSHADVKPIQKRPFRDTGVGENAAKPRTAVGEGCRRRLPGASDGVKVSVDQRLEVRFGFGDGTKNLPPAGFRFDVADA